MNNIETVREVVKEEVQKSHLAFATIQSNTAADLKKAANKVTGHTFWSTLTIVVSIIVAEAGGIAFFFNSQGSQDQRVSKDEIVTGKLCTSFNDTVNRIDTNIQNLGRAFKIAVVTDPPSNSPCN